MSILRTRRMAAGLTLQALGELVGSNKQAIWKLENSEVRLSKEWADKLAPHLNCSPLDLLYPAKIDAALFPVNELRGFLSVNGTVQAGAWIEIEAMDSDVLETVPIGPIPRYPNNAQYVLLVKGNSTNRVIKDGEYAIVVDLRETGGEAQEGDLVVVERVRHDAGMIETTIKRLRTSVTGQTELWPESDDPRHQEPVTVDSGEDGLTAQVVGKVIGKYTEF